MVIIIPARFGSTRFLGKPLAPMAGVAMVVRVIELAQKVPSASQVVVATDDARIADVARAAGALALMTSQDCVNGSERIREAVGRLSLAPTIAVNLQGDAPLTPPWVVDETIQALLNNPDTLVATPAVQLSWSELEQIEERRKRGETGGTFVVFDRNQRALYFSKSIIPHLRTRGCSSMPHVFRHVGLYAYRMAGLERYCALGASGLERYEGLEQLRMLEDGMSIRVVPVSMRGRTFWSVDTAADLVRAEEIFTREGAW